ncbi:mucin-1, partial [Streptomyces sp. Lzd4kr]|nr:mucin-1 [Streptomyces sp. Lzd4kr]
ISWTRRGPLGPTGAYAPRVVAAPDGSRVVLHTTPRRVGLTDTGDPCRGMLAQPKTLVAPPGEAPRLAWWPGLEPWLEEQTHGPALHAVGDVAVSGLTEVVLRAEDPGDDRAALAVTCDGEDLRVAGPGGRVLAQTVLPTLPSVLRILTIGEYVEVYADGVFALTALCYSGRPVPWTAVTAGGPRPVPVRPVRLPDPHRDDASAVWPGAAATTAAAPAARR